MNTGSRPRLDPRRIVYPMLVALLLLAGWQGAVTAFAVPVYLVPSPVAVGRTLVADWALLAGALGERGPLDRAQGGGRYRPPLGVEA
jgi:ABC-type nitrate/sulfonate/bicarbonate transport system permease component